MLEVRDITVTNNKQGLVYIKFQGVDYVTEEANIYAALRAFLVSGQCKPFDLYLLERAGKVGKWYEIL